jgi:hypothetical protein
MIRTLVLRVSPIWTPDIQFICATNNDAKRRAEPPAAFLTNTASEREVCNIIALC